MEINEQENTQEVQQENLLDGSQREMLNKNK
nr:MAG TPA: hypothetical protein [Caudoviricetes sp.]